MRVQTIIKLCIPGLKSKAKNMHVNAIEKHIQAFFSENWVFLEPHFEKEKEGLPSAFYTLLLKLWNIYLISNWRDLNAKA